MLKAMELGKSPLFASNQTLVKNARFSIAKDLARVKRAGTPEEDKSE